MEGRTRATVVVTVVSLVVVAPALAVLVHLLAGPRWFPCGDMAQAELHMRGFFSHPPLVGAAGRIVGDTGVQGSHPGPSLWVAMLPVYLLGGSSSGSLMAAVVSVHLAAVAGAVWLAHRRGGWVFGGLVAAGSLLVIRAAGPAFMVEPWNPWLAVLPFTVYLLLILDVVAPVVADPRRRVVALVVATIVGSHCIQCHAGYLVLVVLTWVTAAAVLAKSLGLRRRERFLASTPGAVVGVIVAGMLMWLPVVVDQLRREPGNLSLLWQHFGSPGEPTIGVRATLRVVAEQFNIVGPWLTGPGAGAPSAGFARYPGFVAMVMLVLLAARSARHRGEEWLVRSLGVLGGFVLVGTFSVLRIFGPFFEYTIRWFWILAMMSIGVAVRALTGPAPGSIMRPTMRRMAALPVVAFVVLSAASAVQAVPRAHLPGPTDSRITGGLAAQLSGVLDPDTDYLVRFWDPYTLNATGFGVVLELERRGLDVGVDPQFAAAALPHRVRYEETADRVLWVVVGPQIEVSRDDPTLEELAFVDPRSESDAERADRMVDEVADLLVAAGRPELVASLERPGATLLFPDPPLPEEIAVRVRDIVLLGQPVAVFAGDPLVTHPSFS